MKNTGIVLSIIIALVIILTGGYFLWQKGIKPTTQTSQEMSLEATITGQDTNNTEVETATGSPETQEEKTGTSSDIDAELKNLDTNINAAFQKDSDGDPTSGI